MTKAGSTTGLCPAQDDLERLLSGHAESAAAAGLRGHVAGCGVCTARLEAMLDSESLTKEWADAWEESAEDSLGPLPPLTLENYTLHEIVNEGTQSVVYRATCRYDPAVEVAVKFCRPGSKFDRRRFEREGDILDRLRHAAIAQSLERGSILHHGQELPYHVMEFVRGEPITAYAERTRLSHLQCAALVAECCKPLAHAHVQRVIHRDLKPSNILVTPTGVPRIIDFGIAHDDVTRDETRYVTGPGQVLGTLPYMSPEQVRGDVDRIDAWTDVYALGVVLFELLAHRRPFRVEHLPFVRAIDTIVREPPPRLTQLVPGLDRGFDTVLGAALAKEPAHRYQTAEDFRRDLLRVVNGRRPRGVPHRPPRRWPSPKALRRAAELLAAFVCGGVVVGTIVALF